MERLKKKTSYTKTSKIGDSRYIHQNKLHKVCFPHNMAYVDFKHLTSRTASGKICHYKALNTARNPKYDIYQRDLVSIVYNFFDRKTSDGAVKNENMSNQELADELHKQLLENLKNEKYTHVF